MINEISIMIELQHYWDNVLKCGSDTERCKKSIKTWEARLSEITSKVASAESAIKTLKMDLKKNELDLEEVELKIKKVEQRKTQLKSEREIDAQNNELILLNENKDRLEGTILELLDKLETAETKLEDLRIQLTESSRQTREDIEGLNRKISDNTLEGEAYKAKYDELLVTLSPASKSRFSKLISSKDGIAIAKLNGETCSHCNFKVPSSVAQSASTGKTLETCTNCGRFIY